MIIVMADGIVPISAEQRMAGTMAGVVLDMAVIVDPVPRDGNPIIWLDYDFPVSNKQYSNRAL